MEKGPDCTRRWALGSTHVLRSWSLCQRADLVLEQSPVLSLADTGAEGRLGGAQTELQRLVLVIQPETQQMWEEEGWAAGLVATSPAQYLRFESRGLSALCQLSGRAVRDRQGRSWFAGTTKFPP